ncbi:MAG: fused MFS/spermidine synthase [Labilithrix sp.]|nr:fused MFS/spermidine synthase [Labilithrix sp.]MCW5833323.1 fused MFS/spermidine synthase [Labilithrix sp.]
MGFAVALAVAAVAGFIALSYEILWYRVISYASWGLPGAFGLLLAAYLFGLAIGSRVAGALCKDKTRAGDTKQLRALAIFTFVANVVAWLVVPAFGLSAKKYDWPPALAAVALAAALLGAILPTVAHFGIKPDDKAGANLSYVYLSNIVGSAAGSLVTGFVFLDLWSLQTIGAIIACVGMVLVAALVAMAEMPPSSRAAGLVALLGVSVVLVKATPSVYDRIWERLLYKESFDEASTRFLDVVETKSGVITVTQDGTVYGGGAYDGRVSTSIRWDRNGIFRAHALGAMHPAPKRVFMIGLATGAWAQVVAHLPHVEKLTVVEINPGYLTLISKYDEVKSLLSNPKVEIVVDDGRRWLNRHPEEKFDAVVMNTTWNWRGHSTNLLSVEFLELVRARLSPGGLFYFNTTSSDDAKMTASTVFPHALRVYNFMAVSDSPFSFDEDRWRATLTSMTIDGAPILPDDDDGRAYLEDLVRYADTVNEPPRDDGLERRESVLARADAAGARVITDDNMVTEWRQVLRFQPPP